VSSTKPQRRPKKYKSAGSYSSLRSSNPPLGWPMSVSMLRWDETGWFILQSVSFLSQSLEIYKSWTKADK